MNNEMILRYLYFLTHMESGQNRWAACYEAWTQFGRQVGHEDYEELLKDLREFHDRYGIKDKPPSIERK